MCLCMCVFVRLVDSQIFFVRCFSRFFGSSGNNLSVFLLLLLVLLFENGQKSEWTLRFCIFCWILTKKIESCRRIKVENWQTKEVDSCQVAMWQVINDDDDDELLGALIQMRKKELKVVNLEELSWKKCWQKKLKTSWKLIDIRLQEKSCCWWLRKSAGQDVLMLMMIRREGKSQSWS